MTIEDNSVISSVYEVSQQLPPENRLLKYIITILLSSTIVTNFSLYNIILIINYNNEITCILENNEECAIKTFPCTYNGITYNNIYEIDFSTTYFGILLAVSTLFLMASGLILIKGVLSTNQLLIQKKNKLNICLGVMTFSIFINTILYYVTIMRANYVIEMQNIGCYTLLHTPVFSWIIIYNSLSLLFVIFGGLFLIITFICISYIIQRENNFLPNTLWT